MTVDASPAADTLVDALSMLTEDVALSIWTVVLVPLTVTSVEGPVIITSLEVPDTVIVVVRSSKVTSVVLSGMLTVVVEGSMVTAVVKSGMESTVEIEVNVKIVLISDRVTIESVFVVTVKIVDSVPSVVTMDSVPKVACSVDSGMVTLVVSLASVPSVYVLVVPEMVTSVVHLLKRRLTTSTLQILPPQTATNNNLFGIVYILSQPLLANQIFNVFFITIKFLNFVGKFENRSFSQVKLLRGRHARVGGFLRARTLTIFCTRNCGHIGRNYTRGGKGTCRFGNCKDKRGNLSKLRSNFL